MASIPTSFPSFPTTSARTEAGVTHIDLNFASAMSKGSGTIIVTDGAVQTVIDRVTGQPKLRVVGGSFSKEIPVDQVSISGTHVLFDATGLPPGASLNVYMGAGTLLSGGKAAGAITVPGSATFTTPAGPAPVVLGATIAVSEGVLKAGSPLDMTVTFTHTVNDAGASSVFSAEHARVEFVSRSEDGLTWRFRLVQDDSLASTANVVRLNLEAVQPRDNVSHSGTVTSSPYAVDTVVDSHVGARIDLAYDGGASASDGITNDHRQVVTGTLVGTIDEGEHLELVINNRSVDASKISFSTADGVTTWRYDSRDERIGDEPAHAFEAGANTITARVVGNGHESPAATRVITLDTTAPGVVGAPSGNVALDLAADLVITFTETVHWFADLSTTDPAEKSDVLAIWIGDGVRRVAFDTSWLSEDGRSLRIPASVHQMMADTGYHIVLPRTLTDTAGNPFGEYEIYFHTDDGLLPSADSVKISYSDGTYRAGETIEFYVSFSEAVKTVGDALPSLILSNGKEARLEAVYGSQMMFSYTVGAGDDASHLRIADTSQLVENVSDLAGKPLDAAHILFENIYDGYGNLLDIEIDTIAPTTLAAPTLDIASDSGTTGDGITRHNAPTLRGTAEANARVAIYDGTTWLTEVRADSSGAWSATIGSYWPLEDGVHNITVVQRDRAGNESPASAVFKLTVDSAAPAAPAAPVLAEASDSGTLGDGLTSDNSPTLSGTAEANATIEIYDGAILVGTTSANASGAWNTTIGTVTALANGAHSITVRQVDLAGNASPASAALALTIDTGTGAAPAAPLLAAASDSGALGDNLTNDSSPTLSGTVRANATVEIYEGATLLGSTTADAAGAWEKTVGATTPLADGVHNITIKQIDGAGSSTSNVLALTIDGAAPFAPAAPALASGSDTNYIGDNITSNTAPTLTGTAEAGATVDVYEGAALLGSGTANASGVWFADLGTTTPLTDGLHNITIRQVDRAGNSSAASSALALRIDTGAPAALTAVRLAEDTGLSSSDGITRDDYNSLVGSGAEPFAEVRILLGTTVVGIGTSDADGHWIANFSSPLAEGVHTYTVRQTDAAGNLGAESAPVSFTVDRTGPTSAPPAPLLAVSSDSGASDHDGITSATLPTFTGTGALANTEVALFMNEHEVGRDVTDASGSWSITLDPDDALSDGYYGVQLQQFDLAGNKSPYSSSFNLRVDTTPASAPGRPVLAAASDSGSSNSDGITSVLAPRFSGSGAEAGATIVLYAGTREIGRMDADASGNWDLTLLETNKFSADGSYAITAKQIDKAGNTSAASEAFTLVIDTSGPLVSLSKVSLSQREFQLGFNEEIVFRPSGQFNLLESASTLLSFVGNSSSGSWYLSNGTGGEDSVLNFKISMSGIYNLSMANDAIQDVAGNSVQIVGSPQWVVDLLGPSA
jgi:hypothetical protein